MAPPVAFAVANVAILYLTITTPEPPLPPLLILGLVFPPPPLPVDWTASIPGAGESCFVPFPPPPTPPATSVPPGPPCLDDAPLPPPANHPYSPGPGFTGPVNDAGPPISN